VVKPSYTHKNPRIQTHTQGKGYRLLIEGRGSKSNVQNCNGRGTTQREGAGFMLEKSRLNRSVNKGGDDSLKLA
jgi:hypothetical protein